MTEFAGEIDYLKTLSMKIFVKAEATTSVAFQGDF